MKKIIIFCAVITLMTHNVFALTPLEQFFAENGLPLDMPITIYNLSEENPVGITVTALELIEMEKAQEEQNTAVEQSATFKAFNLLSDVSDLSVSSHIELNGVNVGEDGLRVFDNAELNGTFTVTNSSQTSQSITVILSTYTADGKLHQLVTTEAEINGESSENLNLNYRFDTETESRGKIMFWNSAQGMLPIRTALDFTQASGVNAYYYNVDNRLLQIDKANGTSIYFTYDNMGSLLTKTVEGAEENE